MLNRRDFHRGLPGRSVAGCRLAQRATTALPFYASAGPELTLSDLDVGAATLTPRVGVTLPANLQYAWPHPSRHFLYVVASNSQPPTGPTGVAGADKHHYAIAYRIGADGALTPARHAALLPARPLHVTTTIPARSCSSPTTSPAT